MVRLGQPKTAVRLTTNGVGALRQAQGRLAINGWTRQCWAATGRGRSETRPLRKRRLRTADDGGDWRAQGRLSMNRDGLEAAEGLGAGL